MNIAGESICAMCRRPYVHFPAECKLIGILVKAIVEGGSRGNQILGKCSKSKDCSTLSWMLIFPFEKKSKFSPSTSVSRSSILVPHLYYRTTLIGPSSHWCGNAYVGCLMTLVSLAARLRCIAMHILINNSLNNSLHLCTAMHILINNSLHLCIAMHM